MFMLLFGAFYGRMMNRSASEHASGFPQMLGTRLAHSIGTDALLIWAATAAMVLPLGSIMALTLAGNGILIWGPAPFNAHTSYTLTLPISRFRLIWTRMLAGLGAAIGLLTLGLISECAILVAQGRTGPLVPIALSAVFSMPIMMACTTVLEALRLLHQGAALWVVGAALFVFMAGLGRGHCVPCAG